MCQTAMYVTHSMCGLHSNNFLMRLRKIQCVQKLLVRFLTFLIMINLFRECFMHNLEKRTWQQHSSFNELSFAKKNGKLCIFFWWEYSYKKLLFVLCQNGHLGPPFLCSDNFIYSVKKKYWVYYIVIKWLYSNN